MGYYFINMEKSKKMNANSFLVKVFEILEDPSNCEAISWTTGEAFEITDLSKLINNVLPKYFKHQNFSSFIRQLNMYDFHKLPGDSYIFQHPLFTKKDPAQFLQIKRKSGPGKNAKKPNGEMIRKIKKLKENNKSLENTIEKIENMCNEVASYNQILMNHLKNCQDREKFVQETLKLSMNCLQ